MSPESQPHLPFHPGALIIATLASPREKFWGAILHLSSVGLSLRGVDLSSFDDFVAQIRDGEPFNSGVVFFPMHRLERLELDLPEGNILSLAQRFAQKTGQDPAPILVSEYLATVSEEDTDRAEAQPATNTRGGSRRNAAIDEDPEKHR
jgi:hypothetical protein